MIFFIFLVFIQGLLTLCICQQPHLPSLLLSLFFSFIQNWNSQLTQYKSVRCTFSQVNCLPRTQAIHVGTKRQMWSWHQWTLEWEQLKTVKMKTENVSFFSWKNRTHQGIGRCLIEVQNPEKGIQVAANSVVMSRTLQKRTQVFWFSSVQIVVFVTSSPNVSKEVASVAASEPPRPRAASVQATLQDIAFKAMLRRLEQFKFSSQIGTYRGPGGPGGPASGERENEWFKWLLCDLCILYVYFLWLRIG